MVGMGKAMFNWIDTLEEHQADRGDERAQAALRGLKRLQRTLIDGATTTTNELKEWAWSPELATTPSISSAIPASNPLETVNASDDVQLAAIPGSSSDLAEHFSEADEGGTFTTERTMLPPNTYALENSPSKGSFRSAGSYPHPPNSFSRTRHSQMPQKLSATTLSPAPVVDSQTGMAIPVPSATLHKDAFQAVAPPQPNHLRQPDHPGADYAALNVDKPTTTESSTDQTDVDPLSGLTVNHELRGSTYSLKRLGKDPLNGLGIL